MKRPATPGTRPNRDLRRLRRRIAVLEAELSRLEAFYNAGWSGGSDTGVPDVVSLPPKPAKSVAEIESELALLAGELR